LPRLPNGVGKAIRYVLRSDGFGLTCAQFEGAGECLAKDENTLSLRQKSILVMRRLDEGLDFSPRP
jgi:hypothetical protein